MKNVKTIFSFAFVFIMLISFISVAFAHEDDNYWLTPYEDVGFSKVKVSTPHTHQYQYPGDPVDFRSTLHVNVAYVFEWDQGNPYINIHIWKQGNCIKWWDSKHPRLGVGQSCKTNWRERIQQVGEQWKDKVDDLLNQARNYRPISDQQFYNSVDQIVALLILLVLLIIMFSLVFV